MKALIKTISLMAVMVVLMAMTACDNKQMSTMPVNPDQYETVNQMSYVADNSPTEFPMFSDNNQIIGYLMVANDSQNLYVTFGSANGWLFAGTNLLISTDTETLSRMEQDNPSIADYTISEVHKTFISEYTYQIPLAELGLSIGTTINIFANSDVVRYDSQTDSDISYKAWNGAKSGDDNSLWQSVQYTLRNPFNGGDGSIVLPKYQASSPL